MASDQIDLIPYLLLVPLAYLTAKTNGLEELAAQILTSSGIQESDIEGLPNLGDLPLQPPPVITHTANHLWPMLGVEENFFDKALANGHVSDYVNSDAAANTLESWEAGEPEAVEEEAEPEEGEGWDLGGAEDDANPTFLDAGEDVPLEDEGDAAGAARGVSEPELWARNSNFAADHVAAGEFESAMQVRVFLLDEGISLTILNSRSSSTARLGPSSSHHSSLSSCPSIVQHTSSSPLRPRSRRCTFTSAGIQKLGCPLYAGRSRQSRLES